MFLRARKNYVFLNMDIAVVKCLTRQCPHSLDMGIEDVAKIRYQHSPNLGRLVSDHR
jgi:hypothetical protein